ncbi:VOC family protein [Halopenitus persicus]|uniref:VOC family protein n=1 Tax=Halopenitus persicus TaxID=1048396 RepID=UPI003742C4B3
MDLRIDHVTIAGRDLEQLTAAFTAAGLPAEYGGTHSNGVTEMSIVGFRDGSYLELVSTVEPGLESPWWDEPIRRNGGPCAWAPGSTTSRPQRRRFATAGSSSTVPRRTSADARTACSWNGTSRSSATATRGRCSRFSSAIARHGPVVSSRPAIWRPPRCRESIP